MGKQGRKGAQPSGNLPTLEMTYWDADWGDANGPMPMIGAHFDAASAVTIWAQSPRQIAAFLDWLFTRAEASDDARRASGSLRGEFDFQAMGMQVAQIDGSICVNVPGKFVGLMLQAPNPQAFGPFMRIVLQTVLGKREREMK
jgi:hypothetical protein